MTIALGLAIVAQFGLVLASFVVSAMSVPPGTSWIAAMAEPLAFGIVTLTFPTVGAVVLLRRPSHPIGRLMSIVARLGIGKRRQPLRPVCTRGAWRGHSRW